MAELVVMLPRSLEKDCGGSAGDAKKFSPIYKNFQKFCRRPVETLNSSRSSFTLAGSFTRFVSLQTSRT
jgi:hypothetical protein